MTSPAAPAAVAAAPMHHERAPMVQLYFKARLAKAINDPVIQLYSLRQDDTSRGNTPAVYHGSTTGASERSGEVTWRSSIAMEFHFETRQQLELRLCSGSHAVATVRFLLSNVVAGRRATLEVDLPSSYGTLWVSAEEAAANSRDTVVLWLAGKDLKKMDFFGLSDPYFKIFKLLPNGERKLLYQSSVEKETLDPKWRSTPAIFVSDLVVGTDYDNRCIQIECWDDNFFKDDKMGQFKVSLNELLQAAGSRTGDAAHATGAGVLRAPALPPFRLVHATKPKEYGEMTVPRIHLTHIPTFTEFLRAGLEINLAVSIDFTASNGDPRNAKSLHHSSTARGGVENQYMRAIRSVCDILMEYDTDKLVPVFGFGAKIPTQPHAANHCFHLNGQPDPHVRDVDGIIHAYRSALSVVTLSGPTNFEPTIRQATRAACASPGCYTILLILTDGCITDTDRTIDAIVDAGEAPLSIIIVGVGEADFSLMEVLDGDDDRLTNRYGKPAARDLVQFVPFLKFEKAPRWALAAEVLEEVPRQVEEWAMINHIDPRTFESTAPSAPPTSRPGRCAL